ncbi:hypothetical protein BDP27DRAFT_1360442 [Rhodocollybia butyracea]|uniref:Uncharacterized protein n=1 Tax=Rhodocollybia butyracea TaxID=206335 RepID=A0A9P5Q1Q8_9AGAR|nr:hypothetical protein BDP27DRAFT_1360442 [Rhodocollybia butyracea]
MMVATPFGLRDTHCREDDVDNERPMKRARTKSSTSSQTAHWHPHTAPVEYLRRVPFSQNNHHFNPDVAVRPIKPLPRTASNPSALASKTIPAPQFSGNFGLFSISSDFIPSTLFNNTDTVYPYRTLYKILSENECSVHCFLPSPLERHSRHGLIRSHIIRDPLNNEQLDIGLYDIREEPSSSSSLQRKGSDISMEPVTLTRTPGLFAGAHVIGEGASGDIIDGFGELAFRRAWCDFSEDGILMEVFEGHLSLQVFFGELHIDQGLEDVVDHRLNFWAARSNARLEMADIFV